MNTKNSTSPHKLVTLSLAGFGLFSLSLQHAAPCNQTHCLECDENNYCSRCQSGYYIQNIVVNATSGICLACDKGCRQCLSRGICTQCFDGFAQNTTCCPKCSIGCKTCDYFDNNCTACTYDYILDENFECNFRYTTHLIVGSIMATFVVLIGLKFLFDFLCKRRQNNTFVGSVLDEESRKNTYYVHHIVRIGQTDDEGEISKVETVPGEEPKDKEDFFITDQTADVVLTDKLVGGTEQLATDSPQFRSPLG